MDSLFCKAAVHGITSKISFGGGLDVRTVPAQISALGRGANATGVSAETAPSSSSSSSRYSFTYPLRSLWPGNGKRNDETALEDEALFVEGKEESEENAPLGAEGRGGNWVLKILHVGSLWAEKGKNPNSSKEDGKEEEAVTASDDSDRCSCCEEEESDGCGVGEKDVEFDRDSFSRLLKRVSLVDAKRYAQMSYLGNIAYCIEKIKPGNLLKYHGLRFITSSVEKKAKPMNTEKENTSARIPETEIVAEDSDKQRNNGYRISASAAYHIAASAASYLQSQTRSILPFKSARSRTEDLLGGRERNVNSEIMSSEVASFVATTNSMTSVVAAKEEMKEAVAKDLNSAHSSPCEWFICDDESSGTRFFVIQGSESLTSWQANLLFEPIEFEGLDVLVHRGIYEAAKGMYRQMLPEIRDHLKSRGSSATLCFTGHSLGGSLSLLVNLMLLMRGEAPLSSLLPVVTFGAPSIMCGGDYLLRKLGLPRNHVQAIIMHRDIVPRAFSCSYPDHVAELLKAINGNFRNHPCLNNQKLLYAPMGELLILQPDEKFSPHHHLLPSGSGLYLMGRPASDSGDSERQLQAAQSVFLNSPHPLEILSDPSAYGSGGAIYRDHDMNSYLRSVRSVIRQELKRIRKAKREHRRLAWWHLVASQGIHASAVLGRRSVELSNVVQHRVGFSRLFRSGGESLKRFSTLVASQHVHMFLVLLLPVRFLLLKMYGVVSLGR